MRLPPIPLGSRLAAAVIQGAPAWSVLAASQAMGKVARLPLPRPVARAAAGAYTRVFEVDLSEAEPRIARGDFCSIDEFFTRRLRSGARTFVPAPGTLLSPCDGRLRSQGKIFPGGRIEAKGVRYALDELLDDVALASRLEGGWHATIYLHPRDYHRVHAPCEGELISVTAIPGGLSPVNDAALDRDPAVLARNERQVHHLRLAGVDVVVVMVAAFGVGHMRCSHTPLPTHPRRPVRWRQDPGTSPRRLAAGEELGVFHLGSTVVVLAGPGLAPEGPGEGSSQDVLRAGQTLWTSPAARGPAPHGGAS